MLERDIEHAALDWFQSIGYQLEHGPTIAPGQVGAERSDFSEVVLQGRLRSVIQRLNPAIPEESRE
ncbi:MAG: hypothetical protein KDI51_10320, partial [Xanthomonadales bacterium]|nr:hypothetical protein [Xanthomonadales bacterium]